MSCVSFISNGINMNRDGTYGICSVVHKVVCMGIKGVNVEREY
jgi:hypothetical protein